MRLVSYASLLAMVTALGCAHGPRRPNESAPTTTANVSASQSDPKAHFVAHPLEGPFSDLDAYCSTAAKREQWSPDRHCRPSGPDAPHASSVEATVRLFHIDDKLTGMSPIASCGLVITTAAGTFVDAPKDAEQGGGGRVPNTCDGLLGPTHDIHTDVEELAWKDHHVRMRFIETFRWWGAKSGKLQAVQTRERLVLCSVSANGVPRCTPPIDIACSDFQNGDHALTWSIEGNVLRLRSPNGGAMRPEIDRCDVEGEPLVVGDFVLW